MEFLWLEAAISRSEAEGAGELDEASQAGPSDSDWP